MIEQENIFYVDKEKLNGTSLLLKDNGKHNLFSFHGAGRSNKERTLYLLRELVERTNSNAFTFDFSGHGQSSGQLNELSLEKRAEQARSAIEKFGTNDAIIIGSSMSGDTALRMLNYFNPKLIVLFCPAIYASDAFRIPFTNEFTEIIRKPNSWKSSDVLKSLEEYQGKLLVFIGTEDEVIPEGVIELLDKHSSKVSKKEIIRIPNCPHRIHEFLPNNEIEKEAVISKIVDFMKD
jgi:esterase/lipase